MATAEQQKPLSILDIGVGMGQYGFLLRTNLENINLFEINGANARLRDKNQWKIKIDGIEGYAGERRDAALATQHAEWAKNLALKQELVGKVTALAALQSDRIKEWNQKTQEILAHQKQWESIGGVSRSKSKNINKQFWSGFKSFFSAKSKFFNQLESGRKENLEKKRLLVKEAEALRESKDWDKTSKALRQLQARWKEIGPVPDKFRESIYAEFKGACDHFFGQRRAV